VKVLFLSQRVPYPPNRGDKITTWRLVDRLRREHEVTCVAFAHDEADLRAAGELNAMGIRTFPVLHRARKQRITSLPLLLTRRPLTLGVYGSRELQAIVDHLAPEHDMAYAYSSSMGAFLEPHAHMPRVMHFGELDSDKWRQYAERSRFPMNLVYKRECRTLTSFERRVAARSSQNVFCTPLEERIFQDTIPGRPSCVLRNGVDLEYYQPDPAAAKTGELVFIGVMDYLPNIDGCTHFVADVLPLVRAEFPDTRFTIVGSKPTAEVRALGAGEGIEVTGFVDDTRDWIGRACISVAPLRIARGIQNKVLEALAMGLPTVGTTSATQGVDGTPDEHYLVRADTASSADAVIELLESPARAADLARAGRRFVEETYDWEVVFRHLDEILAAAVRPR